MQQNFFPVIDPVATGANIVRLRQERGLSVRDLQAFFGFEEPQAIYKWQRGQSLPSVDTRTYYPLHPRHYYNAALRCGAHCLSTTLLYSHINLASRI